MIKIFFLLFVYNETLLWFLCGISLTDFFFNALAPNILAFKN